LLPGGVEIKFSSIDIPLVCLNRKILIRLARKQTRPFRGFSDSPDPDTTAFFEAFNFDFMEYSRVPRSVIPACL